jgi:predicted regulator of Ras-like GTPase activity (Roadblock/LC7/MglB family)
MFIINYKSFIISVRFIFDEKRSLNLWSFFYELTEQTFLVLLLFQCYNDYNIKKNKYKKIERFKMNKIEEFQKLQEQLADEMPAFVSCGVIAIENGLPIAGVIADPNTDLTIPAGAFTEAFKSVVKAYEYSNWGQVTEMLFSGHDIITILFSLENGNFYQGISVKTTTTLGMVKAVYNKYRERVEMFLKTI